MRKLKLIPVLSGGGTRSGTSVSRDSLPPTLPTNHERYNETYTVSSRVEEQNTTQLQQDNEVLETNNHLFSKMKSAFVDSYQFFSQKNSNSTTLSQLPLYEFLRDGKDRGKGWLKSVISPKSIKKGLDQTQGLIYLLMMCFFRNLDGRSTVGCFGHGALLCNAFGVGREHGKKFFNRVVSNDFKFERKQRTDTGMSVFNCEKKRRHAFTAFNTFKKRRFMEFRDNPERIDHNQLKEEFYSLTSDQRNAYHVLAERDFSRSETIWDQLKEFLLVCKGKIPYIAMACHLGHIVCVNTIRKILLEQEGYYICGDRILPHLDTSAKF